MLRPLGENSIEKESTRSTVIFKAFSNQKSQIQTEPEDFENSRSIKFNNILNHFKKIISKVNQL